MRIEGKSVLITGAGSGIGRATAIAMAHRGAYVALAGRNMEHLRETAGIVDACGGTALSIQGDVCSGEWRDNALDQITEKFGGLDVLVNNAGVVYAASLEDMDPADIRDQVETNLIAPMLLTQQLLPTLRESDAAAIVNVSSSIGLIGQAFYSAYAASKSGMSHFTETLRQELIGSNIHVMCVYSAPDNDHVIDEDKESRNSNGSPEKVARDLMTGLENDQDNVCSGDSRLARLLAINQNNISAAERCIDVHQASLQRDTPR